MSTETANKDLISEATSTAQVIKMHKAVDTRVIDQHLKGMFWRYNSSHRDSAVLVLSELMELDVDQELVDQFKRIYVGDV